MISHGKSVTYKNYLNLKRDELDKPVYRIMPVNRLLQCLGGEQIGTGASRKMGCPI